MLKTQGSGPFPGSSTQLAQFNARPTIGSSILFGRAKIIRNGPLGRGGVFPNRAQRRGDGSAIPRHLSPIPKYEGHGIALLVKRRVSYGNKRRAVDAESFKMRRRDPPGECSVSGESRIPDERSRARHRIVDELAGRHRFCCTAVSRANLRFEESHGKNTQHRQTPRVQTVGRTGPARIEEIGSRWALRLTA
jgi:hypothetical protein